MTLVEDGTFHSRWTNLSANPTTDWSYDGIWEVKDGFLVCVVTNANTHNTTNAESVDSVERYSIVRVDKNQLVLVPESGGPTNSFERR
jgi:calcineurin-like phosphoesterase family protein